ncbi:hypothetical protein BaRGS_00002297, partial [Batillaria attramentaria]
RLFLVVVLLSVGACLLFLSTVGCHPIGAGEAIYRSDSDPQSDANEELCASATPGTYVCDPKRPGFYIYCSLDPEGHSHREEECQDNKVFDNPTQTCVPAISATECSSRTSTGRPT